jgi:hypothetical protein
MEFFSKQHESKKSSTSKISGGDFTQIDISFVN